MKNEVEKLPAAAFLHKKYKIILTNNIILNII